MKSVKAMLQATLCVVLCLSPRLLVAAESPTGDKKESADRLILKGGEGPGAGKHIVFITGEEYYRSEQAMPMLAKILSQRHGFDCTVLFAIDPKTGSINPNQATHLPGLEALKTADLMVLFIRFRQLPDRSMKFIADHIHAGKPVVGFRNATHPFRYPPSSKSPYAAWSFRSKSWPGGFGQQILGDTWVSHHGKFLKEATLAKVNPANAKHPVLQGVSPTLYARTDVNGVNKLTAGDTILFHGHVLPGLDRDAPPVTDGRNKKPMPWAWFKTYRAPHGKAGLEKAGPGKTGRAFCLTAGSAEDWLEEDLRRLVVNAMFDLTGLEKRIPKRTNVDFVEPYKPQPTGSRTNEQWKAANLTPADFGLKD